MGLIIIDNLNYYDVKSAVQGILKKRVPIAQITLRMIREETGDWDSSPSAISKHLSQIKAELERSAAINATRVTKRDIKALRTLIFGIAERSSSHNREEMVDLAHATAGLKQEYESALETKDDTIRDLEHQVFGLQGECGMVNIENDRLNEHLAKYEGRVEALSMIFGLIMTAMPAVANGMLLNEALTPEQLSILEEFRAARIGRISTPQEAEEAYAAGGCPHRVS